MQKTETAKQEEAEAGDLGPVHRESVTGTRERRESGTRERRESESGTRERRESESGTRERRESGSGSRPGDNVIKLFTCVIYNFLWLLI